MANRGEVTLINIETKGLCKHGSVKCWEVNKERDTEREGEREREKRKRKGRKRKKGV